MGSGLAILAGLLGGGATGVERGVGNRIADQQKEAALAENARQFNEGNFTPTGELPKELSSVVPSTTPKVRNTLLPTYEKAREAVVGREVQGQQQTYFQKLAEDPRFDDETRALFKVMAAPGYGAAQAAGTTALGNLNKVTPHIQQGLSATGEPEYVNIPTKRGSTVGAPAPEITGIKAVPNRNATAQAFDAWLANPTKETRAKLDALMGPTIVPADAQVHKKSDVILGAPNTSQPLAENTTPAPTTPRGTAPERSQLPEGRTSQPQVSRQPTSSAVEIEKAAKAADYLTQVSHLADLVEQWHKTRGKGENITMAGRNFVYKNDPTGLSQAAMPLDKEAAEIKAEAERLLRDYEANKGGMRAVSGPQIQAALSGVHGGDALSNPNAYINLRNLARAELDYLNTLGVRSTQGGRRDIYSTKPPAPMPKKPNDPLGIR